MKFQNCKISILNKDNGELIEFDSTVSIYKENKDDFYRTSCLEWGGIKWPIIHFEGNNVSGLTIIVPK